MTNPARQRGGRNEGPKPRGSQRWLQLAVNRSPDTINAAIASAMALPSGVSIQWRSPLEKDDFREYQDSRFLRDLGVELQKRKLSSFWPRWGPVWDGLARTSNGRSILVEAKANIPEFHSSPCGAGEKSLARIKRSLDETKQFLSAPLDYDWTRCFYQVANRLAHLYLLKELNGVDAALVFVFFIGDTTISEEKCTSRQEWEHETSLMLERLGIRRDSHWLHENVFDVFIEVDDLVNVRWP